MQVVWFKRDLRVRDHAALTAAVDTGAPVLPIFVIEPSLVAHPHTSPRHVELVLDGLADLRESLAALGAPLVVRVGEVVEVLEGLSTQVAMEAVHSHEEFGVLATWERDRAVAAWCRARGARYLEHRQSGAVRGLASRDAWSRQRMALFNQPLHRVPAAVRPTDVAPGPIPALRDLGVTAEQMDYRQRGGERAGREVMRTWLTERVPGYERRLSSPV
ncbi:MAG: deoxyribodipyrimidine photo-lyase, partial [Actinomycetales bacterium]